MPNTEKEEDLPQVQVLLSRPKREGPLFVRALVLVLTLHRVVLFVFLSMCPPSRQAGLSVFSLCNGATLCAPPVHIVVSRAIFFGTFSKKFHIRP